MPAASTSATIVAMGGTGATGCTCTVTADGTGAGGNLADGVVGVGAAAIAGRGSDAGGVVVVPSAAAVVALGVVRAGSGLEEGTDDARWGLRAMTVVTARVEARHAATRRAGRRLPRLAARLILRPMPSTRPVSDVRSGAGEAGGALSTMC